MTRALIVDVDGVVSPVHGHTAWGDDVVAGNVFGPVLVSPTLCARLNQLATLPDLLIAWLTSWSPEMRSVMDPFPGRDWLTVPPSDAGRTRTWWKRDALEAWLDQHPTVDALCWLDDHLRAPARATAVRRRLATRGVDTLLLAPATAVGLTPHDLLRVEEWFHVETAASAEPSAHRAPNTGQSRVEDVHALSADSVGRWLVYTRRTCHFLDLDQHIYERRPGLGSSTFDADATPVRLTRMTIWPEVGSRMVLWFDDPDWPDAIVHWRISGQVQRITRAHDEGR